jgi:hypothetical protein
MQYTLLIYTNDDDRPAPGSPEAAEEHGRWMDYTEQLRAAGVHVGGEALHPTSDATTVRVRGERIVTDGPFAETKEWLAGFYIIDVEDIDAALDWAARIPNISYGTVEVRPVINFAMAS